MLSGPIPFADTAPLQSESVLIQKIYTHFKKTPGTHKLGVLYVVDSVTRKWLEQAKSQGQPINSSAQDGTYAAGVHRVTELMPVLMNDILQSCPEDQKVRVIRVLICIGRVKSHTHTHTHTYSAPARRRLNVRFVSLISGISGEPEARQTPALVF